MRRGLRIALRGRRDPLPVAGRRSRTSGGIGDLHTRKVLDLTIRLAEVMLSSGSGTADVVATAQDVAQAYQLTDCVVDITVTTIIVSALATTDTRRSPSCGRSGPGPLTTAGWPNSIDSFSG